MTRMRSYGPSVVLLIAVGLIVAFGPNVMRKLAFANEQATVAQSRAALKDPNQPLAQLSRAFRTVAVGVEPSVVHVTVKKKLTAVRQFRGTPEDLLRRYFDRSLPEGDLPAPDTAPDEQPDQFDQYQAPFDYGNGSGWVYDDQGHIITNHHVVKDADEVVVKFHDKSQRKARVIGVDPNTDIAVLKVDDKTDLHPAKRAEEAVEQGDMVFAFGSPFRIEFSMSQGIVMGKSRQLGILGSTGYENFIQTDAVINPGNSGGPLTNVYGEVVGMNTAIATQNYVFNGIGFAIPVKMVEQIVDQIITKGEVTRGYLGVWIRDIDERMAESFGYKGEGVLIQDMVGADSPAAKAGLKPGDIIIAVEGEPVRNAGELRRRVAVHAPGKSIKVSVFREGDGEKTYDVMLVRQPTNMDEISRGIAPKPDEPGGDTAEASMKMLQKLGIEKVTTLTQTLARAGGLDVEQGVVIIDVRPGSVAAAEGIRRGAVILQVAGTPVANVEELVAALESQDPEKGIRFRIHMDRTNQFVLLALPK